MRHKVFSMQSISIGAVKTKIVWKTQNNTKTSKIIPRQRNDPKHGNLQYYYYSNHVQAKANGSGALQSLTITTLQNYHQQET